jgi:uncharacterized protein (DUF488 family)
MQLFTVGHGTMSAANFTELMRSSSISKVVDIRSAPGSRHNPQFGRLEMEKWLPPADIAYRWEVALGGFRKASATSPHMALRHPAFRGYADHMLTEEFSIAIDELVQASAALRTVLMCSESVWWRCHRRLASDYLTRVRGVEIRHVMHDGTLHEHRLTDGVRAAGEVVLYDRVPGRQTDAV